MTDHAALLTDLERGPGSRELSDRVLLALGWRQIGEKYDARQPWVNPKGEHYFYGEAPDITCDMQPVLDELPEGWRGNWNLCVPWRIEGVLHASAGMSVHHDLSSGGGPKVIGLAPTPALAGCIALVKIAEQEKR